MLLVALGLVGFILIIVRIIHAELEFKEILGFSFVYGLLLSLCIFIFTLGLGAPFHGYYEPVITEKYELVELLEGTDVYIIEDSNREPFFKYVEDSYETGINDPHNDSNIEIVVSDKYKKPTLVKYDIEAKKGILGLGLFGDTIEYKIYAAKENIIRYK